MGYEGIIQDSIRQSTIDSVGSRLYSRAYGVEIDVIGHGKIR